MIGERLSIGLSVLWTGDSNHELSQRVVEERVFSPTDQNTSELVWGDQVTDLLLVWTVEELSQLVQAQGLPGNRQQTEHFLLELRLDALSYSLQVLGAPLLGCRGLLGTQTAAAPSSPHTLVESLDVVGETRDVSRLELPRLDVIDDESQIERRSLGALVYERRILLAPPQPREDLQNLPLFEWSQVEPKIGHPIEVELRT